MCFLFSNKKGPPNNQLGATDRKTAPENFPWEEFQKLPRLYPAPLCGQRASAGQRLPRLASPECQPSSGFPEPGLGKCSPERFTDVDCKMGRAFRIYMRNLQVLECRGNSLLQMREDTSILPTAASPPPLARPPDSPTRPPGHMHRPPGPASPRRPQGEPLPDRPPPGPTLSLRLRRRPGNRTRARLGARLGRGTWRAGRGAARVGDEACPRVPTAGGRAGPPGAAPGVVPRPPSPAVRRRSHQHLWNLLKATSVAEAGGSFSSEPTRPTLWSVLPWPGLAPLRAPLPQTINYQPPFCRSGQGQAGGREETAARITSA